MATVIKAGEAGPVLKRLSTVDLADHLAEADAVVAAARRRGAGVLSEVRAEAERIRVEARESGYQTGYEQGLREGTEAGREAAHTDAMQKFDEQHANVVADMQQAIRQIDKLKGDLRTLAERDLLEFAVHLASRLTTAIGQHDREAVVKNFQRAIRQVGTKTDLTVSVHPDDAASLRMFAGSMLDATEASQAVTIVEDTAISRGGCVVKTDRSCVDATLETQLDEMVSLLLGTSRTSDVTPLLEPGDD